MNKSPERGYRPFSIQREGKVPCEKETQEERNMAERRTPTKEKWDTKTSTARSHMQMTHQSQTAKTAIQRIWKARLLVQR